MTGETEQFKAYCRAKADKLAQERQALERAVHTAEDAMLAAQQALADWVDQHDGQ